MRTSHTLFVATALAAATLAGAQQQPAPSQPKPAAAADPNESVFNKTAPVPAKTEELTPIPGLTEKVKESTAKPGELLGDPFESQVAGLTFHPPAGTKRQTVADADHNPDHVVDYADAGRGWLLKVTRARLAQPMALQTVKDPQGAAPDRMGLLDYTVGDIVKVNPAAEVLRQDIFNVGEHGVGIAVLRFNLGNQRYLRQQALFQVSEQLYYVFNLTTPAGKQGRPEDNPEERLAVETFKAMLETVQVLDRQWIRTDQTNRLFRTRALFVDWGHRDGQLIKHAAVPHQWHRIVRNGKDVGYTYRFEQVTDAKDNRNNPSRAYDGVLIGVRSRTYVDGNQFDSGSQMFVSLDRKHEDWATVTNLVAKKGTPAEEKKQQSEYGFSEIKMTRKIERDPQNPRQQIGRDVETYSLSVSRPLRDKDTLTKPEYHNPSPWYIPQAIGAMLPRLLPVNRPVTYLFQTYSSDERAVVHRYVDVGFRKEVNIDGRVVQAIPITDRLRLEGAPTTHYVSPDGQLLATITEAEGVKVMILPATKEQLEKIWPNEKIWPLPEEEQNAGQPQPKPQPNAAAAPQVPAPQTPRDAAAVPRGSR